MSTDPGESAGASGLVNLIQASIKRVPANVFALGMVGVVAAAVLSLKLAGGNWLIAVGGGVATLSGMVLLRIFAKPTQPSQNKRYSAPSIFLTWTCLAAFVVVLSLLLVKMYLVLFPQIISAPIDNVRVLIKAVEQGTLQPTNHTVLTVKTFDEQYIKHEVIPDTNGETSLSLPPGKYRLGAIGAPRDLAFEVAPPQTIITIRVRNGLPLELKQDRGAQEGPSPATVRQETSGANSPAVANTGGDVNINMTPQPMPKGREKKR